MPDQATTTECPPLNELEKLVRGRCTDARNAALCEHVGACPECQRRLEALTGSAAELAERLREAEEEKPPVDSAYWRAIARAEEELLNTSLFPVNGFNGKADTDGEIRLDFLQPADKTGKLGRLGAFDVVRVVGRGGMGVVLHAYDPSLDRDVAIKVIDPQLANNEVARQRFCREARAAAAVTHDNLVAVHQVSEDEPSGLPYLVMQLVVGESLEQRIKRVGRLTPAEVARIGMQAAAGLAAAHSNGLIHRDIKPANILLEAPADRVKLTDFGLARAAEDVKLTRTGFVAGSPLYMAPEQARGEEVDPRADLFSLGTVLYEAATGTAPFEAKTPLAVLRRVSDETQMPLKRINAEVPAWLSDAVDRLLAKDAADRFQSAAEVAEVFATGLAEMYALSPLDVPAEVCAGTRSTTHVRKPICWKAIGCRVLPWAAGAVGGALAVGLLWMLFGGSASPPAGQPQPEPQVIVQQLPPVVVQDTRSVVTFMALDVASGIVGPPAGPGPVPKRVLQGDSGAVWAVAFLPGDRLVVGMEDGSVKVWNLQTAEVRRTLEPRLDGTIWTADVSPDGKYIVVTCDDANVPFWNATTYKSEGVSFPHQKYAKCAVFSPAGDFLAIGDRNSMVRVWNWEHHIPVELPGHRGTVHSLAFSTDGTRLASAGSDGKVKLWNLQEIDWLRREGPKQPLDLAEHKGPVYGVAISPDGKTVASAGWDGTVRIWDAETGAQRRPIKAHDGDVWSVSFGGNGKWVASAGSDGWVRVWNVDTGAEVFAYRGTRAFHVVRFAPDGTTLAAGGRDGTVRVWDVKQ